MGRAPITVAGRTCVVTGAASGIGRAFAQRVSRQGSPVVICDWDEHGLAETAATLSGPYIERKLDVRDRNAQLVLAAEVREWMPAPLGVVFNNAGVTVAQLAADASPEDDEWVIDVNLWGVVHGTQAYLPILLEQGSGAVVNVSSVFGLMGFPSQTAYCASKFAVRGYTEALRHELRGTGATAVCVHPGGIRTNIVENARFRSDDRGGTDHAAFAADFQKVAKTSPERAAATIQRGLERGNPRILIGQDATAISVLTRLLPVRYYDLVTRLEPVLRPNR